MTNSTPANVQVTPEFKGWTPPESWWVQPRMRSSITTFYLCRPGGIAWSEAASIAQKYNDAHGYRTFTFSEWRSHWRSHAKVWFLERHPEFDFVDDGECGKLVLKSGRQLGRKELVEMIEGIRGAKRQNPDRGTRRSRRSLPGAAPVKYAPKDYDIGNGNSYVYAYYYPEYRKKQSGSFKIKVGRSVDYRGRIAEQSRATGMPEEIEVAVLWRTDKPEAAEKLLHDHLKFRGKHLPDAPGREWFLTSPDEIRKIIESIQPGVSIRKIPTAEET